MNDKILRERERISQAIVPPFPSTKKYDIIVADPPWQYSLRDSDSSHRGRCPYPTMPLESIAELPVDSIASERCYLWLWTTKDHITQALSIVKSWGFEYKNLYVWVKTCKSNPIKPILGIGHWGRNTNEFLILAVKGKCPTFTSLGLTDIPTVILAPREGHSQKPEQIYQICEKMSNALSKYKKVEKIELFARSKRDGWEFWGNEV